nr:MAG TPA: hypothetical protein [Caudoviricetes sp.]
MNIKTRQRVAPVLLYLLYNNYGLFIIHKFRRNFYVKIISTKNI